MDIASISPAKYALQEQSSLNQAIKLHTLIRLHLCRYWLAVHIVVTHVNHNICYYCTLDTTFL